jgi:hypothetical protein
MVEMGSGKLSALSVEVAGAMFEEDRSLLVSAGLSLGYHECVLEKGNPVARRGRKAAGLQER